MSQLSTEYQVREQMFAMLYEDYQQPIERFLVKRVDEQESARDLCQETFKQLWEFLCKETVVKQYAYYRNWLYKTAKYRAIDYLRRNKPMVYLSQSESEANSWFDELRIEGLEDRIDLICMQDDLLQLPPEQREYLVEYASGHKQKEIAAKKGISESTVSEYMSQGRTNLRKKYYLATADIRNMEMGAICLNRKLTYKYKYKETYTYTYRPYKEVLESAREWGLTHEQAAEFAPDLVGEEDAAEFVRIYTSKSEEEIEIEEEEEEYQIEESFRFMNGAMEFNEEKLSEADRALWYAHPQRRRLMRQLAHETARGMVIPSNFWRLKQPYDFNIPIEGQQNISKWNYSYTLTMEEYRKRFPCPKLPVQLHLFDGE
jgi:RNA polymerase sigma-70 factor, ECF subfamily